MPSWPVLPEGSSIAERLACHPDFEARLASFSTRALFNLSTEWLFWSRAAQQPPSRDWRTWLIMAGRGFGKTRAGAEWVRMLAERRPNLRIALVAGTMSEARNVMVEGESGLLAIASPDKRPLFEPSLGRVTWPNGTRATLFSAAEPEGLRGFAHHYAWADEIAKWPKGQATWDNLAMGLRLGIAPRSVATTTPRPVPLIRWLMQQKGVTISAGRTIDNDVHLAPGFLGGITETYGGTRLGRQELDGELIDEFEGALWSRDLIEACRVREAPAIRRVLIGVDPPAGAGPGSDACGIVVVARCSDDAAYVLEDASVQGLSPEGWARAVVSAAERHQADKVIAEANIGGAMVESVLRAAGAPNLPITLARAALGKAARAEPVATLYQAKKAFHVGAFPELEDELAGLVSGGEYCGPGRSPDRADALVWAMTALMLGKGRGEPRVRGL